MGLFSSLIGGALSLFGGRKQKDQVVKNEVDYGKMVSSATAAGFNPLTALRNGGSAGFTTTTSPSLSNSGSILGNIGGVLGEALDNKAESIKEFRPDTALMDYQLRGLTKVPTPSLRPASTYTGVKVSRQATPVAGPSAGTPASVSGLAGNGSVNQRLMKNAPVAAQTFFTPPKPVAVKQPDAMPIWVRGSDRDGQMSWIANPDGPDLEQMGAAYATRVIGGYEKAADSVVNWRNQISSRKLTPSEKKEQEKSWLPSWVPRFKVRW